MEKKLDRTLHLGKKIEQKMDEIGISQSELARRSGLSRNLIYSIINETKNPGIITIDKIARAIDLSLDDLVGRKPKASFKIITLLKQINIEKKHIRLLNMALEYAIEQQVSDSPTDVQSSKLILLKNISNYMAVELLGNREFKSTKLITLLEAVYDNFTYAYEENNGSIDEKFINWYLKSKI